MGKTQPLCPVPSFSQAHWLLHPSSRFHFLIFLSFLLLRPSPLLLMSLSPMCHCSHPPPPPCLPLPAQRAPPPRNLQRLCCHAVSQINVEILTSDGPGRRRSSGGRGGNGSRGFPIVHPTAGSYLSCPANIHQLHKVVHRISKVLHQLIHFLSDSEVEARWRT